MIPRGARTQVDTVIRYLPPSSLLLYLHLGLLSTVFSQLPFISLFALDLLSVNLRANYCYEQDRLFETHPI